MRFGPSQLDAEASLRHIMFMCRTLVKANEARE